MALNYQVAITSVWWQRGGVDTRLFSTKALQKAYFDAKSLVWNSLNNFNINDNISTTIVFRDTSNRDIETLLKCNYAVIKKTGSTNYRYFFIKNIKQDSSNQVVCNLELDDIQTNFVGNLDNFNKVYVRQWTGDNFRYSANNGYYYSFNNKTLVDTGDAPTLFNKSTTEVYFNYTGFDTIDAWLNENIEAWRYVFINNNNQLGAPKISDPTGALDLITSTCMLKAGGSNINLDYGAIHAPVYKKGSTKKIYLKYEYNGITYYNLYSEVAIYSFFLMRDAGLSNYPIGTYGIEEKISNLIPFSISDSYASDFTIDADGDLIINASVAMGDGYLSRDGYEFYYLASQFQSLGIDKASATYVVGSGYWQQKQTIGGKFTNPIDTDHLNYVYANQKLLDINFSKLRLRIANQYYDYNPLAYLNGGGDLSIYYTEALKVGTSKIYLRFSAGGDYMTPNENDYTGLVANLDLTEPILTNQWADYLASHKNYYLQTAFNVSMQYANQMTGVMTKSTSGASAMLGSFTSTANMLANVYNKQLDRENMQQSPNGLSNANGDPYFNVMVSGIKPVLDYLSISDEALKVIQSKFKAEGVPFEIWDSLSNLLFKHSHYTALQCDIEATSLDISTLEYDRLKNELSKNNRFWYSDFVNINSINYYTP